MSLTKCSSVTRLVVMVATVAVFLPTMHAATLKIMPLGDSITCGLGAPGGYRLPLHTLLTNAGCEFQFVGSTTENPAAGLPAGQQNHEGHVAYTIQNCTTVNDNETRTGILENAAQWLNAADPDVILLMIGTNDINANYDRPNAPSRLENLLTTITGLKPDAKLIVAQITPIGDGWASTAETDALAHTYNQGMATVVANQRAAGKHVTLVDMHTPLNATTDLADGLHPNQSGYNKMGQVWFDGIQAAIAVPEPASGTLSIMGAAVFAVACALRKRMHTTIVNSAPHNAAEHTE